MDRTSFPCALYSHDNVNEWNEERVCLKCVLGIVSRRLLTSSGEKSHNSNKKEAGNAKFAVAKLMCIKTNNNKNTGNGL